MKVSVGAVVPKGEASKAGVRPGDVIIAIGSEPLAVVPTQAKLTDMLSQRPLQITFARVEDEASEGAGSGSKGKKQINPPKGSEDLCFTVDLSDKSLVVACHDERSRQRWISAVRATSLAVQNAARGSLKHSGGKWAFRDGDMVQRAVQTNKADWRREYFVLYVKSLSVLLF